jgi:hypothetical protein
MIVQPQNKMIELFRTSRNGIIKITLTVGETQVMMQRQPHPGFISFTRLQGRGRVLKVFVHPQELATLQSQSRSVVLPRRIRGAAPKRW